MENLITTSERLESYLTAFADLEKRSGGQHPAWLRSLREDAFARFCQTGFPTTHDEDWRFTNVSAIANTSFEVPRKSGKVSLRTLESQDLPDVGCTLVFVDGQFAPDLSSSIVLKGVKVGSLAEEIRRNPRQLEVHLGRYLNTKRDVFCALNTAFIEDGAYVHIARGAVLEEPIYLFFLSTAGDRPTMTHPRNLIVAEENSQATIVEDYASLGGGVVFSNAARIMAVAEDS